MPITKRAIKKMHHDRRRTTANVKGHINLNKLVKSFRKRPTAKELTKVYSALDKAAKLNVIHKNRASRLKSRLSRLLKKS